MIIVNPCRAVKLGTFHCSAQIIQCSYFFSYLFLCSCINRYPDWLMLMYKRPIHFPVVFGLIKTSIRSTKKKLFIIGLIRKFRFWALASFDNDTRLGENPLTHLWKLSLGRIQWKKNPSKSDENKQSNYPANAILVLAPLTPFYLENAKSLQKKWLE